MTKLMDSTPSGPTPMNDLTLNRAQVCRGNDPLQQDGVFFFTKGSAYRSLYQDGEKLFWQPAGQIAKDCTPRW
jgi:hypothetical protein